MTKNVPPIMEQPPGYRFSEIREKAGLSLPQVSDLTGYSLRTVYRWENDETTPRKAVVERLRIVAESRGVFRPDTPKAFTFIDLFAGIGGMRRGFEAAGGRCVFTSEWNRYSRQTYQANFPCDHEVAGDITAIHAGDIPPHDVLVAGFPCQPFSIAGVSKKNALGRPHGFLDETQGTLFFDIARILAHHRPAAFLLENVKNLASHDGGRTFRVICRTLDELGYKYDSRIVDAKGWVPQHRERLFIAGFREDVGFTFRHLRVPDPARGPRLASVLHPEDGSEEAEPPYTEGPSGRVSDRYTLSDTLWQYLQGYAAKHRAQGNGFGFGLVGHEDTARTLSARYYKDGSEILVRREGGNPRRLTPRECARLMGFDRPDGSPFRIPVSDTQAYKQFASASVVPVISEIASLMASRLMGKKDTPSTPPFSKKGWTPEERRLALGLYCRMSFGQIHSRNPVIIRVAKSIGRTPSSLAMKMLNFASFDPLIRDSGRSGLGNASAADREAWEFFSHNREEAVEAIEVQLEEVGVADPPIQSPAGETETMRYVRQRRGQRFFRASVLSSYRSTCCISGIGDPRLLVASHIVPWRSDEQARLDPRNGLCLSSLHDRLFDAGIITVTTENRVLVSEAYVKDHTDDFSRQHIHTLHGGRIAAPQRFAPLATYLEYHNVHVFEANVAEMVA